MSKLAEDIVRSVYNEIKATFQWDNKEAELINKQLKEDKTSAGRVPVICYIKKKGTSFQYSMAMYDRLMLTGIESYFGVYLGEGLYSESRKDNYAFVLYVENKGIFKKYYVADFEPQDPKDNILDPVHIPLKQFKKLRGKLWIYEPYGDLKSLPIFDGFFKHPKKMIK